MKKNDFNKFAMVSLAAGFCVSAQVARTDNSEVAMTKCSKTPESYADEPGGSSSCHNTTKSANQNNSSKKTTQNRKSAAKKAMEIEMSETSHNREIKKSAARRVIESGNE